MGGQNLQEGAGSSCCQGGLTRFHGLLRSEVILAGSIDMFDSNGGGLKTIALILTVLYAGGGAVQVMVVREDG
jgi:hypothetical protein